MVGREPLIVLDGQQDVRWPTAVRDKTGPSFAAFFARLVSVEFSA
jgi:hypothetical protein